MSKQSIISSEVMDLVSATSLGSYSTVEDILRNNLEDVNLVNCSGWTPVMFAANYGHFNIIRLLVRYGCDVNYRDWQGRTALMLAASNGHTRCIDILINYGKADKTLKDLSGSDAYRYAKNCGHGNNKLIKNLLSKTEGYHVKGRPFNAPTPASSPSNSGRKSFPFTSDKTPKDEIYNPFEKTAFSNPLTDFWRNTDIGCFDAPTSQSAENTAKDSVITDYLRGEREELNRKIKELEEKIKEYQTKN